MRVKFEKVQYSREPQFEMYVTKSGGVSVFIEISEEIYNKMRELAKDVKDTSMPEIPREEFTLTYQIG